jgi:hypothetical protein
MIASFYLITVAAAIFVARTLAISSFEGLRGLSKVSLSAAKDY